MAEEFLFPDIKEIELKKMKKGKIAKDAEEIGTSKELYSSWTSTDQRYSLDKIACGLI